MHLDYPLLMRGYNVMQTRRPLTPPPLELWACIDCGARPGWFLSAAPCNKLHCVSSPRTNRLPFNRMAHTGPGSIRDTLTIVFAEDMSAQLDRRPAQWKVRSRTLKCTGVGYFRAPLDSPFVLRKYVQLLFHTLR